MPLGGGPYHTAMAWALNKIGNIHLECGNAVPKMCALNEASQLYKTAKLRPTNVVLRGTLYAPDFLCLEATPSL